jgi:hypothetical protein
MPNTNNKILTLSLNKYVICNNTEHPLPSQEINPISPKIPQTICTISLIKGPQPCCCRDFSAALFLLHFFYRSFSVTIFSINNTCPNNLSQNRYSMIFNRFKCSIPLSLFILCLLFILSCSIPLSLL